MPQNMFSSLYSTAQKYNLKCYKKMRRQDTTVPCPSADNINNKGNIFYSKFLSSATKVN